MRLSWTTSQQTQLSTQFLLRYLYKVCGKDNFGKILCFSLSFILFLKTS